MSNYQFQVMIDRNNRIYRFQEVVSGKVVLDTQSGLTCRNIRVDFGWRTHGKGNQDKGVVKTLNLLSNATQFQSGEHREFPFKFLVPNGPVTYHGHILNVDWYVTAHLDLPLHFDIKNEQDILVFASEAPSEVILGDTKQALSIYSRDRLIKEPADPDIRPGKLPNGHVSTYIFGGLTILTFLFACISGVNFAYVIGFIISLYVVYKIYSYVFPAILNAIWERMFEINDLQISTLDLFPGDQVTCRLQLKAHRNFYLDNINATLTAEEVAVYDDGSSKSTKTHNAYKQSFEKPYTENLNAGRLINFDCVLPVLPTAPATFVSKHNDVKWSIKVRITFKSWPAWEKAIPFTVFPKARLP